MTLFICPIWKQFNSIQLKYIKVRLELKNTRTKFEPNKTRSDSCQYNNTYLYASTTAIVDKTIEFSCLFEAC